MTTNLPQPRVNEKSGDGVPATVDTDTDLNTRSSENKLAEDEDLASFLLSNLHATPRNQRAPGFSTEEVEDIFNLSSKSQFRPPDSPDGPASSEGKHHSNIKEQSPGDLHEETVVLFSDEFLSNSTDVPWTSVEPVTHSKFSADSPVLLPKDNDISPASEVPHWSISISESAVASNVADALWKFKCDARLTSRVPHHPPALRADAAAEVARVRPEAATEDGNFFLDDTWSPSHSALETANNSKQRIEETGEPAKCSTPAGSPALGVQVRTPVETKVSKRSLSQESQRIEISRSDFLKTPRCVEDQMGNQDSATWTEVVQESHPISICASSIAAKPCNPMEGVDSQIMTLTLTKLADSAIATEVFSEVHLKSAEAPLASKPVESRTRVNPSSSLHIYDVNDEVSQLYVSMSLVSSTIGRRNVNKILPTSRKAASVRSLTTGPLPSTERPSLVEASERLKLTHHQQRVINSLLLSSRKKVPSVQPAAHSSGLASEKSRHASDQSPSYHRDNSPTPDPAELAESARYSSKSSREATRKHSRSSSKDTGQTSREKSTSKARRSRKDKDHAEPRPRKQSLSNKPGRFDETETKFGSPDAKTQPTEVKTDPKASKRITRNSRGRNERDKDSAPTDGRSLNWLQTQLTGPKSNQSGKELVSARDRARSTSDVQPEVKTSGGASEPKRRVSKEIPADKREKRRQSVSKPAPIVPSHFSGDALPHLRNLASASSEAVLASNRKRLHSSKPEPASTASSVMKLPSAQPNKENPRQPRNHSKDTEKNSCFIGVSKRPWSATPDLPLSSLSNSKPSTAALPKAPTRDVSITPPGLRRVDPLAMPPTVYLKVTSDSESPQSWQPPPAASRVEKPAVPAMDDSQWCLPLLAQSDAAMDPKLFALMELMMLRRTKTHRTVGMTNSEATKETDSNSQHQTAKQGLDRPRQLMQALQKKSLLLQLQHRSLQQQPPQTRARFEPASTATHPSSAAQEWRSA